MDTQSAPIFIGGIEIDPVLLGLAVVVLGGAAIVSGGGREISSSAVVLGLLAALLFWILYG